MNYPLKVQPLKKLKRHVIINGTRILNAIASLFETLACLKAAVVVGGGHTRKGRPPFCNRAGEGTEVFCLHPPLTDTSISFTEPNK
jgi:hypothetical protein